MDGGNSQFVLRCGQCNKPFDKEASLKRHGYYCRSRKTGNTSRTHSCVPCAREKVRCDHQRPECSRCKYRGKECRYLNRTTKGAPPVSELQSRTTPTLNPAIPSSPSDTHVALSYANGLSNAPSKPLLDVSPIQADQGIKQVYDWSNFHLDFTEVLPHNEDPFSHVPSTIGLDLRNLLDPEHLLVMPTRSPYPMHPMSTRVLVERQRIKPESKRASMLLRSTLRSYPLMVRQGNHVPPFIHSALLQSRDANNDMEALQICISLLHMLNSGLHGSRKLFWRNVRQECEHLCQVVMDLNRWELLAAVQALAMYLIVRISEGETEHNNLDSILQTTVIMVCAQFNSIVGDSDPISTSKASDTVWKEWLFKESKRRVCVIYKVINMLVHFEPATLCGHPTDILIAPLPAKKDFWEAQSELSWNQENARHTGRSHEFALTRHGDLIKVDVTRPLCGSGSKDLQLLDFEAYSRTTEDWSEWCSGMDGFGGLLMLAASMCDQ